MSWRHFRNYNPNILEFQRISILFLCRLARASFRFFSGESLFFFFFPSCSDYKRICQRNGGYELLVESIGVFRELTINIAP